ncbi:MAG: ATP-dependent Clp protease ATP-binding subunit [Chloroflexi bacterium]|nr:MAG: ATP-dependent Clp protease ATP-binding subunit [Chloroflexota bacterium]
MAAQRGTLSAKIPARDLLYALNQAAALMRQYNKRVMTAEMLLLAFLKLPDVMAHRILRDLSKERGFNWAGFERDVERLAAERLARDVQFDFVADNRERVPLSDEMLIVLDEGLTIAKSRNEAWCSTGHALAVMADVSVGTSRLLNKLGITQRAVIDAMGRPTLDSGATAVDHVALARSGQMTPVYFRDDLLEELLNLLAIAADRHVILLGPTGVGKRSLVYALAQLIADGSGPPDLKSVVQMNERALLDNARLTVQAGLRLARGGILFVPDIARFFGGFRADFPEEAGNELQKAFFGSETVIIGTATEGRYNDRLSKSTAIVDHSRILKVPPTDEATTVEILKVLRPAFENDYGLTIADQSLPETARLAHRYYTVEPLPGAAVHLLHRACAMVKMSQTRQSGSEPVRADNRLDADDVMVAASLLTGIPVANMGADERDRYANMVEHLHRRIVGQDEAVLALSRAVKMARVGLKDPKRPIGSFLFLGPTGVGKTELAKALAEFMFGTEEALITLDMSEYMDESSVNRLIGSPPGYVGHEAGGQLTEAVKNRPYSVVLFDEVEKAAVKVFDVLLQIMEEGRLTSGKGETVSFRDCVILMTSNIGGRYLADPTMNPAAARAAAEEELKAHFRPEFLNRLDDIIFFHLLTPDNLRDILDLMLKKEEKLLAQKNLALDVSNEGKSWLLTQNDHPEWGARPLRRIIQKHIREPIAEILLREDIPPGSTLQADVQDGRLVIKVNK